MKKQFNVALLTTLVLAGCNTVSQEQLHRVESQMTNLQRKVGQLEGELSESSNALARTKGELEIVKKQRVVRLPTGAPTEMLARKGSTNFNNGSVGTVNAEQALYQQAIAQFKSGDTKSAIEKFEQFVVKYPKSANRKQALLYLGQAAYTVRDYEGAQRALEPLVVQSRGQNKDAVSRLKMVYEAQGNKDRLEKLSNFLAKNSWSANMSPVAPTAANVPDTVNAAKNAVKSAVSNEPSPEVRSAFKSAQGVVNVVADPGKIVTETVRNAVTNAEEKVNVLQSEAVRRAKIRIGQ